MTLNRRALIKGGAACAGAFGAAPLARAIQSVDVALHDSRFGVPIALAATRSIDLVDERRAHWATIRTGLGRARSVTGITTWSDYVLIAHELERRGFRRAAERRVGRLWRFTLLRQDQRIERNDTLT
ncbi:hypothetical protein [Novosphingobium sp. Fuku2-ISO-50]|uniref:hypothetical protein n=1 Tax=Novosphingobium sp. Fuku2-ISO-50 TaxID=1739114 RepID=UPI00076CFE13|nr:hypothetical protein [Novosphingobium sp. Fuku2-ISO-50]KUR79169.1 hypothetical protein AQZ50_04740 [Novosphingobium sp. Fuku2-ISO-50]